MSTERESRPRSCYRPWWCPVAVAAAMGLAVLGITGVGLARAGVANVLYNSDAEEGLCGSQVQTYDVPHWFKAQALSVSLGCYGLNFMGTCPDATCGNQQFIGGQNICSLCTSEIYQTIELSQPCFSTIDTGTLPVTMSGYLGARSNAPYDDVRMIAEFINGPTVLGTLQLGPVSATNYVLQPMSGSTVLPAGTRQIRVRLLFKNNSSSVGLAQAYADNVRLMVDDVCVIPVKESSWGRLKVIYR